MRKIEKEMVEAIEEKRNWSKDNTIVAHNEDGLVTVYLHSNKIAYETSLGWYVSLCGWNTPTTRSRLNALRGVIGSDLYHGVYQKNFTPYIDYGQGSFHFDSSFFIGG